MQLLSGECLFLQLNAHSWLLPDSQVIIIRFQLFGDKNMFWYPLDTVHKLNGHQAFRRLPEEILNVFCTFDVRPVSRGLAPAVNYYHKELHLRCCSSPRSASDFDLNKKIEGAVIIFPFLLFCFYAVAYVFILETSINIVAFTFF